MRAQIGGARAIDCPIVGPLAGGLFTTIDGEVEIETLRAAPHGRPASRAHDPVPAAPHR